jgi:hypothetical protein
MLAHFASLVGLVGIGEKADAVATNDDCPGT